MRLWLGVLIFVIMVLPWFVALWHHGGAGHLNVFLLQNHLQRFLPSSMIGGISRSTSGHHNPFYYYITQFPIAFLPWSILLIPALHHAFSETQKDRGLPEKGCLFAKCWFFTGIVILSVASTKRALYLMPILAPISMLTSLYIDHTLKPQPLNRMGKVFTWLFGLLLTAIGVAGLPVYFYFKKLYPIDTADHFFVSVVAISLLAHPHPSCSPLVPSGRKDETLLDFSSCFHHNCSGLYCSKHFPDTRPLQEFRTVLSAGDCSGAKQPSSLRLQTRRNLARCPTLLHGALSR